MIRGPYELDEERIPLLERGHEAAWTTFETYVFNLVSQGDRTAQGDAGMPRLIFSSRLRVAQAMLEAYDKALKERRQ